LRWFFPGYMNASRVLKPPPRPGTIQPAVSSGRAGILSAHAGHTPTVHGAVAPLLPPSNKPTGLKRQAEDPYDGSDETQPLAKARKAALRDPTKEEKAVWLQRIRLAAGLEHPITPELETAFKSDINTCISILNGEEKLFHRHLLAFDIPLVTHRIGRAFHEHKLYFSQGENRDKLSRAGTIALWRIHLLYTCYQMRTPVAWRFLPFWKDEHRSKWLKGQPHRSFPSPELLPWDNIGNAPTIKALKEIEDRLRIRCVQDPDNWSLGQWYTAFAEYEACVCKGVMEAEEGYNRPVIDAYSRVLVWFTLQIGFWCGADLREKKLKDETLELVSEHMIEDLEFSPDETIVKAYHFECYSQHTGCCVQYQYRQKHQFNAEQAPQLINVVNDILDREEMKSIQAVLPNSLPLLEMYNDTSHPYRSTLSFRMIGEMVSARFKTDWFLRHWIDTYHFVEEHGNLLNETRFDRPRLPTIVLILGRWCVSCADGRVYVCSGGEHAWLTWFKVVDVDHRGHGEDHLPFGMIYQKFLEHEPGGEMMYGKLVDPTDRSFVSAPATTGKGPL
jgi:hypothetical protein